MIHMFCDTLAMEVLGSIQEQVVRAESYDEKPAAVLMSEFTFRWLLNEFFPGEYHPSDRFVQPVLLGLPVVTCDDMQPGDALVAM
jgi:hypothetical protein